jgi:protein arginine kinase
LLSKVRMGLSLGMIDDLDVTILNELFLNTQPAHLQKLRKTALESSERNSSRAAYIRQVLANLGSGTN